VNSDSPDDLQFAADHVYRAVVFEGGGLAWSPDGSNLAFVSGHGGTSADVYVASRDVDEITRLTNDPNHAYQLSWSPDGQYIFHTTASNFGSGAGYVMEGVWIARADGTGIQPLYEPDPRSGAEVLANWISPNTVLVHSWRVDCGELRLTTIDVDSKATQVVWPDYFNQVTYNPDTDAVLIDAHDIECNPNSASGFYLLEPGSMQPEQISPEEYASLLPSQPPNPVPLTLEQHLETLLEVESVIWVQP
jgi:dipeptidyl aminopeptidase/acylaminoacyl peptidase